MSEGIIYSSNNGLEIAIIGMVGRFPGAPNLTQFWQNLKDGRESTATFSREELLAAGVDPTLLDDPNYVPSAAILEDIDLFDAQFFDYSPREVEVMDPQQRLFLECAWEALEDAGYAAGQIKEEVGVYAGVNMNTYVFNLLPLLNTTESMDNLHILTGNDKDYLTTRVSYKLNLKGPSIAVQTACSTSLVAVHLACRGLLSGDCDMALAGGISVRVPQKSGYVYHEEGIYSPDGHCRAFDAEAKGTCFGSGVGIVVLKRLEDARAAGDTIHAIIKGSAVNNDGSARIGYSAPGVAGQSRVIRAALLSSELDPETISYVEAHGTGTALGDPIEVMALTEAFQTSKKNYCALSSLKTNIGHLDTAAGIAGLIKVILALKARQIPATLHFQRANPKIDFESTPFYVNTSLCTWESNGLSRRAGVSSFGVGGTNAHVILEEAPSVAGERPSRPWQLLILSARNAQALKNAGTRLAEHLEQRPEIDLADVAYTLQVGRAAFAWRSAVKCQTREQAIDLLRQGIKPEYLSPELEESGRPVVFLFPGQGSQYSGMAQGLYRTEEAFRKQVDYCCQFLRAHLACDLRDLLFPQEQDREAATQALSRTEFAQPALFVIEYTLARLWLSWGVKPYALIGHSIGEYVAACLAGVFSLEEALTLVAARGKLIQQLPAGQMLSVSLPVQDVLKILPESLDIAAQNGPSLCVVSGPVETCHAFQVRLDAEGIEYRVLHTSHAFHSAMMEPVLSRFQEQVRKVRLGDPKLPILSNLTGTWVKASEMTSPAYWVRHLRQTVHFAEGLQTILTNSDPLFLEVGPGRTLGTLVSQTVSEAGLSKKTVVVSLPHPQAQEPDLSVLLAALGQLWQAGVKIDWANFTHQEQRRRIPLPTYAFERQRFWIDPPATGLLVAPANQQPASASTAGEPELLCSVPVWRREVRNSASLQELISARWLIFQDQSGFGASLLEELARTCPTIECIEVCLGESFQKKTDHLYHINPQSQEDYQHLFQDLKAANRLPRKIIYLWGLEKELIKNAQHEWFFSLLFLVQAIGRAGIQDALAIEVIADHLHQVTGGEELQPEKALLLGPCRVIPREYPQIRCRTIDIRVPASRSRSAKALIQALLLEFTQASDHRDIAYRGLERWVQEQVELNLRETSGKYTRLRQRGVYLLTGGLGGVSLALAEYLARTQQARLALLSRHTLPPREEWPLHLQQKKDLALVEKLQAVQRLEDLGAEVWVISADVTVCSEVEQTVRQVRERFGDLHGVIHAAGVPGGGLAQLKTRAASEEVLQAKVTGTRNLAAALAGCELDFFVLCSSTIALTGDIGQIDYCAANNFLDAFAHYRVSQDEPRIVSINWDGWEQVGMNKKMSRLRSSLLDELLVSTDGCAIYLTEFCPQKHWVLAEHTVLQVPVLPGVAYLQMLSDACKDRFPGQAFHLKDVLFISPLHVQSTEKQSVYTILEKAGDAWHFRVVSRDASHAGSASWKLYASGKMVFANPDPPRLFNLAEIMQGCVRQEIAWEEREKESVSPVEWGPRWRNLRTVYTGEHKALAEIELASEFGFDLESMDLHPALLDMATGFAGMADSATAYVPCMYGMVRQFKPLPAKFFSYAREKGEAPVTNDMRVFDITLLGVAGEELVTLHDFTMIREDALLSNIERQTESGKLVNEPLLEQALTRPVPAALSVSDATWAFEHILNGPDVPQVVVTAGKKGGLLDLARQEEPGPDFAANPLRQEHHARPQLVTEYVAPRNQQEEMLVSIWQEILGVEQIGIHDNFFDLGGHSLLALQIADRLRKAFDLSLPLGDFIQTPTIAGIAEVISQNRATKEEREQKELLEQLSTLSDEEVEVELRKRCII